MKQDLRSSVDESIICRFSQQRVIYLQSIDKYQLCQKLYNNFISMKSFYDFQGQINAMGRIFKQQVSNAQKINSYLQKMPQTMVTKLANQLRQEYQNLCNDSQDQQKLNSIKQTLNLASGERATNLDSLFIELAEEINTYYKKQYFSIKKQIPFTLQCDICRKYVANDRYTCELHKSKCWKMKQRKSFAAPQRKNVKKKADTKEKYQDRQKLVMETVNQANLSKITWAKQSSEQGIKTQKKTISKSKAIKSKKQVKNAKDTSNIIATQFKNKFLTKTKDIQQQQQQQQSIIENQLSNYFNQEEELFLQMLHKNNRDKDIHTGNFLADFSKNAQGEGLNKFVEDAKPEMNNQFLEE